MATTDTHHPNLSPTNGGNHVTQAYTYADSTARLAATGFTAADVGKDAEQQSDGTWWKLTNHSPITWKEITGGGTDADAIHDNVAGEIAAITEKTTPAGADLVVIEDSEDSNNKKRVQFTNFPAIQDAETLLVQVRKDSSGTINVGQTVYLAGWDVSAEVPTVELADASSSSTMPAFGVARSTITDLATGTVVVSGELTGQATSGYSVGDSLYVSETAGALTDTKPTGTALIQKIGQVTRDHPTLGVIQVFGAGRSNDVPNIAQNNVWMGNGSGVATATSRSGLDDTALHDDTAGEIAAITAKGSPTTSDRLVIEDAADSNNKKSITIGDLPAATPAAHASTHQSGGGDAIKLDDLAAADDNTDLNATTSAHGLLPKLGGGTTNYLRADGTWAAPAGGGSEYWGESDGVSSTTSTDLQTKLDVTQSLSAGDYEIEWYCEVYTNTINDYCRVNIIIDPGEGGEDTIGFIDTPMTGPSSGNYSEYPVSGFAKRTLSAATHTFRIAFSQIGGCTAYIRRARLHIREV